MSNKNGIFEFKDLTNEELEQLSSLYAGYVPNRIRVGPKGYFTPKGYITHAADIYNMELKEGDVFVTGYPKSGTTMAEELVWLVANNLDYEKAAAELLRHRSPYLEIAILSDDNMIKHCLTINENNENFGQMRKFFSTPPTKILSAMPSPRSAKTHLPMSLLPPAILDIAKVVYLARDPRDVALSYYHYARLWKQRHFIGSFKDTWNIFMKDLVLMGPYFEHVKEAWALREHPNMLFLFYEDFKTDLSAAVNRVANFLGKDLTPEQTERLCNHLSIENFKNNKSVNLEEMREFGFFNSNESFIRKGEAGGWKDYFDEQMQRDAERWIADSLKDSDLRFPSMNN